MATRPAQSSGLAPLRIWLVALIIALASLVVASSAMAAEEPEGGGGELPPTETETEPPPTETEPPPETTTPTEPETPPEAPKTTPETTHTEITTAAPNQGTGFATSPTSTATGNKAVRTPTRQHASGGSKAHSPKQAAGGGKKSGGNGGGGNSGSKAGQVSGSLKSISASVDSIFSSALPPQQLAEFGRLLADNGLAPHGNKHAQKRAARKITASIGAALLSSAVGLTPPQSKPAPQPIPFVPIHGGPKYLNIVLLLVLVGGVLAVLIYQLRPVLRSRRPRTALTSVPDTKPKQVSRPLKSPRGNGRVVMPREPARRPVESPPGRRKTR